LSRLLAARENFDEPPFTLGHGGAKKGCDPASGQMPGHFGQASRIRVAKIMACAAMDMNVKKAWDYEQSGCIKDGGGEWLLLAIQAGGDHIRSFTRQNRGNPVGVEDQINGFKLPAIGENGTVSDDHEPSPV
jgi:hypothetical protein